MMFEYKMEKTETDLYCDLPSTVQYEESQLSCKMFPYSSTTVFVKCIYVLSILMVWFESTSEAPTSHAVVSRLPGSTKAGTQFTTTNIKEYLTKQIPCDLSPGSKSNSLTEAVATVALIYVGQNNFMFIAIESYDAKYFSDIISSYTSKEFNRTKFNELYQINQDHMGLVRVLKVNDRIKLDLEGASPGSEECIFKVSRYLCTQKDIPIADYMLFESKKYSGHYIRRYDNTTSVDCEPIQPTVPTDAAHFYWRASKTQSSGGGNDYIQLLSYHDDDVLSFSNNTALMDTDRTVVN